LPSVEEGRVVVPAPLPGAGNWAGAPHAILDDGVFWLSYRLRTKSRGTETVVARSEDGERFATVATIDRVGFGTESFERPCLVRRPQGGWRLYVCCATPRSKHWWIEAIDADEPSELPAGERTVAFPGSTSLAVKDPVVEVSGPGRWRAWVCCHPLTEPGEEDRMTTAYATSADGLSWHWHGEVLRPIPGTWDERGARMTTILSPEPLVVLYDGRASAEENWFEKTGIARRRDGALSPDADGPAATSPHSDGALRYATAVPLSEGGTRFYFEAAGPDGSHDLWTSISF